MASPYCTAVTANHRYCRKKSGAEMPSLEVSDGRIQRLNAQSTVPEFMADLRLEVSDGRTQCLNADGLIAYDRECVKRGLIDTIVYPVKVHVQDESIIPGVQ